MPRILLIILISTITVSLKPLNFAYKAALAAEEPQLPFQVENSSKALIFQDSLSKLFEGTAKEIVQRWMKMAENDLKEGAQKTYTLAKTALKTKIGHEVQNLVTASQQRIKKASQTIRGEIIKLTYKIKYFILKKINWSAPKTTEVN